VNHPIHGHSQEIIPLNVASELQQVPNPTQLRGSSSAAAASCSFSCLSTVTSFGTLVPAPRLRGCTLATTFQSATQYLDTRAALSNSTAAAAPPSKHPIAKCQVIWHFVSLPVDLRKIARLSDHLLRFYTV
jgi:hypothetical protein